MSMNKYTLGTLVRMSVVLTDKATPPAPLDATVAMNIETPDGTVTALTVVHDGVGLYHADYTSTVVGLHQYEVLCSGAVVLTQRKQFLVNKGLF